MSFSEALETGNVQSVAACCANIYSHPLALWLLGGSLHPGGLKVTDELSDLAGINSEARVLDVGCGVGASAIQLAGQRGCHVTGITLEQSGVDSAMKASTYAGLSSRTAFSVGNIESWGESDETFDVVLMECVLSTLTSKKGSLLKLRDRLRPGGRIAVSDVTVDGDLPDGISGVIADALCIGDALSLDGYEALLGEAGFRTIDVRNAQHAALDFISKLQGALLMAGLAAGTGRLNVDRELIDRVNDGLKSAKSHVESGAIGYCMIVGEVAD